jgi:hypothetical protein
MAADLAADLDEAEAEGGSAEDVLGNSAFDPRRFASAWAVARGVTGPPTRERWPLWRPPLAIVLTAVLGVLAIVAALALLGGHGSSSIAIATRRIIAGPGSNRIVGPGRGRIVTPGPFGLPFNGTQIAGFDVHPLAWILLLVGIAGIGVLIVLYWSPWSGFRRRRHENRRTPSW